jgi:hypothetical protein
MCQQGDSSRFGQKHFGVISGCYQTDFISLLDYLCQAMLPSPISSGSSATISSYSLAQSNYSPAFQHPNQPEYLPQSLADQSLDPNAPEIFKQNIQLVQQHVARVNGLARSALDGM